MADSEEATNPTPEEPKLEESKLTPAPAVSQEEEKVQASKSQDDEKAQASKSQEPEKAPTPKSQEDEKVPAGKADAAAKPAKKPAKQQKEQPDSVAGASANLSLSDDDVETARVVTAQSGKS